MQEIEFVFDNPELFRNVVKELNFAVYFEMDSRMKKQYQIQLIKGFSEALALKPSDDIESKKYIIKTFLNTLKEEFNKVDNYELSALARDSINFVDGIREWI